jgi:glycosyltransferase involved in cell wall biosynthesis
LSIPFLSIIVPAHNEEARLPKTLEEIFAFLQAQPYMAEVIVVENACCDHTLEVAQSFQTTYPNLRVIQEPRRGKGMAVQRGMLEAQGEFRFMADADLSMSIEQLARFLPPALVDYDIAIASREAPGAVRYNEPYYRHLVGRIFNTLIRMIALPGLDDTQCGFKCFRSQAAEDLFGRLTLSGWSFDVEILFIARQLGYRIVEVPIAWTYNPGSKISVLKDSARMGLDLLRIRLNGLRGKYKVDYGVKV